MRFLFPFVTRDHHEQVCAELKMRIGDLETERKKLMDQLLEVLGGAPIFSARKAAERSSSESEESQAATSEEEQELEDMLHRQFGEYVRRFRPSQLPHFMENEMKRAGRKGFVAPASAKSGKDFQTSGAAAPPSPAQTRFDEAEAEVKGKYNA